MWEYFGFYGMRALLVLYMVNHLKFTDFRALGVYAVYTGLVELGGLVGGVIADRILGLRHAISIGGWLIAAGYIVMALQSSESALFLGLAFIILGSSLFSTNISALLGLYFEKEDPRREEGFTILYVWVNLGTFVASLLCGAVGAFYGWNYGFIVAAMGMIAGNVSLYVFRNILEDKGLQPRNRKQLTLLPMLLLTGGLLAIGMAHAPLLLNFLPWISVACVAYVMRKLLSTGALPMSILATLCIYVGAVALFFAVEDLLGSTFMLFSERHATNKILGLSIPATVLISLNPLTILLLGSFFHRIYKRFMKGGFSRQIVIAFLMAATSFAGLAVACLWTTNDQVPVPMVMTSIVILSLAELLIGPAVYSYCSEISPEGHQGAVMGLVHLGFSLANFLGGLISQFMAIPEEALSESLNIYSSNFGSLALLLIGLSLVFGGSFFFLHRMKKPLAAPQTL